MKASVSNEFIEEKLKIIFPTILTSYRECVESTFKEEFSEVGFDIFVFMQPVKAIVLIHERNTHILFYKHETDEISFMDCTHIPLVQFYDIDDNDSKFKRNLIKDILLLDLEYVASISLVNFIEFGVIALKQSNLEKIASESGVSIANKHYKDYELSKAFKKAFTPSSKTQTIDTELIIQTVNNPSFTYEFGESVKAYNSKLYLAAAATSGIALENLLRILIIKNFGKKRLPDKTYIDRSVRVLDEKEILPGRLRADILKNIGVRNANAHTNKDPVRKDTVEALFRIIFDVSDLL